MQEDTNSISTHGLPDIEQTKSEKQEFLTNGYRLYLKEGSWFAEKNGEMVKIDE